MEYQFFRIVHVFAGTVGPFSPTAPDPRDFAICQLSLTEHGSVGVPPLLLGPSPVDRTVEAAFVAYYAQKVNERCEPFHVLSPMTHIEECNLSCGLLLCRYVERNGQSSCKAVRLARYRLGQLLLHDCSSFAGSSGAPVLHGNVVVGVHINTIHLVGSLCAHVTHCMSSLIRISGGGPPIESCIFNVATPVHLATLCYNAVQENKPLDNVCLRIM